MQLLIVKGNTLTIKDNDKVIKIIKNIYIGKNGYTDNKTEGDYKTPIGMFKIGTAFGFNKNNFNYPYYLITNNTYFVDDYKSKYYNKLVEISDSVNNLGYEYITCTDKITWDSAEKMSDYPKTYELGLVIEYNMENPFINGAGNKKGSAIFIHVKGDNNYTAGCIALDRKDMLFLLNFLDKEKDPHIWIKG